MLKWIAGVTLALICLGLSPAAHAVAYPSAIFPTAGRIAAVSKLPDWGGYQTACKNELKIQPYPLGDFSPSGHYDAKGESPIVTKSQVAFHKEATAVYRLGVCYQISHDHVYAAKAESLLDSWAATLTRIGSEQGEDEFNFFAPPALASAYVLKSDPAWNSAAFAACVRQKMVPAVHTSRENNHGNWGVLLQLTAGAFLQDDKLINASRERWLELMRSQVAEDGSLPRETCRSDTTNWCDGPTKGIKGISYEHWTLLPVTMAAEIYQALGMDVYATPEGALLHRAYARLAAWTLHPETFPYYAANNGHLIGIHNDAYFYILQGVYPVADAAAILNTPGDVEGDEFFLRALYGSPTAK